MGALRKSAIAAAALVMGVTVAAGVWLAQSPRSSTAENLARRGNVAHVELGELAREPGGFVSQEVRLTSDTGLRVELKVLRAADG